MPASEVKLADVRPALEARIYDAKLQERIDEIFGSLQQKSRVENLLTGDVFQPDGDVLPASATVPMKSSGTAAPGTPTKSTGTAAPSKSTDTAADPAKAPSKSVSKPGTVRR